MLDLIITLIAAATTVYAATPWLIRYLRKIGLVVIDQNKYKKPLVPISGGLGVMCGIFAGLATFIFLRTFLLGQPLSGENLTLLFVALTTIILITFIGFVDDLMIKQGNEKSEGLRQWQKPLLTLGAAIPLMVINAGTSNFWTPVGVIEVGLIYPLLIIPIGVVGAANMANMLAGYNGLEAGIGFIITAMLGSYALANNRPIAGLIGLTVAAALLAFYFFNKVPAKILAGDSLTYLIGASIACIAIIGNIEKAALIVSAPFFIEFILKARAKFNADSFGNPTEGGKITSKYNKVYSIPHFFARKGIYTEKQITYRCCALTLIISCIIWFI